MKTRDQSFASESAGFAQHSQNSIILRDDTHSDYLSLLRQKLGLLTLNELRGSSRN